MTDTTPTREQIAEALFYAARRDDWGVANADERQEFYDLADSPAVLALFSQPSPSTPSAGACICTFGPDCDGPNIECPVHGLPPRIEDMAPGTTFTGTTRQGFTQRFERVGQSRMKAQNGTIWNVQDSRGRYRIDPSTVRDVTPPPALPEAPAW